jgi:adenylylsulfate reductase subunit A
VDILLIGGGMACCGAGYEIMRWMKPPRKTVMTSK